MKKQLLLFILALIPLLASAQEVEINGINYYLYHQNNEATVTSKSSGYIGNIDIPTSVTYEGVEYSVKYIGDKSFSGCTGLTSITIPNSVTFIDWGAFEGCTGLTSINIPNSVTYINGSAFSGCSGLTSINISNGVTGIGDFAFSSCLNLTTITIPNSVISIGEAAFGSCPSLASIVVENGNNKYDSRDDCNAIIETSNNTLTAGCKNTNIPNSVTTIGQRAFEGCTGLTSITIPQSVTTIGNNAFSGCTGLNSISIPNSVTKIDSGAFLNCTGLHDFYCYAESLPTTSSSAFNNSNIGNATLHVPEASMDNYKNTDPWMQFKNIVAIAPLTHTLTYVVDGETYKTYEVEEGENITPEPEPIKEGYTFSGWSEIPETMPDHDVAVTGSFTINKYTLTYMVDGKEYKTFKLEYGESITPESEPSKEGYTFSGWSWIPSKMPAENVTITGSFSINKYTLTYMVDGDVYKSYEVEYGATITPEAEPTKEGYTFSGWSWIPSKMPAEDVIVSGSFAINSYKLTYMIDDKVYKEVMYEYGVTITPEPQPEGDYQTFEWLNLPQTMPAHDVVVYASYTTGIAETLMTPDRNARIYSLDGKAQETLHKGLNIVRRGDGTTKKVVVK